MRRSGLAEPRPGVLRVFRDERLKRVGDCTGLRTRSTYLEGLRPGEAYAAEAVLLGREGWTRLMGRRKRPSPWLPPDRSPGRLSEVTDLQGRPRSTLDWIGRAVQPSRMRWR